MTVWNYQTNNSHAHHEFLLDAREKKPKTVFPLGFFLYPPPAAPHSPGGGEFYPPPAGAALPQWGRIFQPSPSLRATPPQAGNFTFNPMQRFCPRGKVSASADEGGIPVVSFLLNGWHYIFSTLPVASRHPAPGGEFNIRQARKFCPL